MAAELATLHGVQSMEIVLSLIRVVRPEDLAGASSGHHGTALSASTKEKSRRGTCDHGFSRLSRMRSVRY